MKRITTNCRAFKAVQQYYCYHQKLDVSDREAVKQWAQETVQDHGSVNLIFNNAGVALGSTVEGATYEDLEWIVGINFWGVVYGTKEFLPFINKLKMGTLLTSRAYLV